MYFFSPGKKKCTYCRHIIGIIVFSEPQSIVLVKKILKKGGGKIPKSRSIHLDILIMKNISLFILTYSR